MTTGERIKQRRKELGLSADYLAEKLNVSRSTIFRYENGEIEKLPVGALGPIAKALHTTPAFLMGWDNNAQSVGAATAIASTNEVEIIVFPIIGSIAAGYGGLAIEEYTGDYEYIPLTELHAPKDDYFVLRVNGSSMHPKILDGDKVLIRRKTSVDSGKIAVILYDGEEATVKKVNYVYGEDWLELIPINPEYETKRVEGADLEECRVLGEVVKLIRDM